MLNADVAVLVAVDPNNPPPDGAALTVAVEPNSDGVDEACVVLPNRGFAVLKNSNAL